MPEIYRVCIHGKTLESRDLRKLLARAVEEKRNMDRALRFRSSITTREELICPGSDKVEGKPWVSSFDSSSPLPM